LRVNFARPLAIVLALLFGWSISPAAWADAPSVISLQSDPDFADVQTQLQALVNTMGFHKTNHFCIITYAAPKGDSANDVVPFIYWPTQNKFIEWKDDVILNEIHYFDLTRDILPDGSSSIDYLTRSGVNHLIHDCRARGDNYKIIKTAGGWVPISHYPQFATIKAQLQDLVDHDATQKINKFCVIGQKDSTFLGGYVYWLTGDQLLFWLPNPHDIYESDALTYPTVEIDLKHGLRDEEDARDDRDEMQRSYAETILQACQKSGQNFVIAKSN
jgi:hypothetical protein